MSRNGSVLLNKVSIVNFHDPACARATAAAEHDAIMKSYFII